MKPGERIVRASGGRAAPLRQASTPAQVGRALEAGVIVETDPLTAEACGACLEDCADFEEALAAAEAPAEFGDRQDRHGAL